MRLLGGRFKVGDQISALVGLLQTSEHHFRAWDVLLWILEVFEECILSPGDSLGFVGVSVAESGRLSSLASEESGQVGSDLVLATGFDGVALGASLNEELLSLLYITSWNSHDLSTSRREKLVLTNDRTSRRKSHDE